MTCAVIGVPSFLAVDTGRQERKEPLLNTLMLTPLGSAHAPTFAVDRLPDDVRRLDSFGSSRPLPLHYDGSGAEPRG